MAKKKSKVYEAVTEAVKNKPTYRLPTQAEGEAIAAQRDERRNKIAEGRREASGVSVTGDRGVGTSALYGAAQSMVDSGRIRRQDAPDYFRNRNRTDPRRNGSKASIGTMKEGLDAEGNYWVGYERQKRNTPTAGLAFNQTRRQNGTGGNRASVGITEKIDRQNRAKAVTSKASDNRNETIQESANTAKVVDGDMTYFLDLTEPDKPKYVTEEKYNQLIQLDAGYDPADMTNGKRQLHNLKLARERGISNLEMIGVAGNNGVLAKYGEASRRLPGSTRSRYVDGVWVDPSEQQEYEKAVREGKDNEYISSRKKEYEEASQEALERFERIGQRTEALKAGASDPMKFILDVESTTLDQVPGFILGAATGGSGFMLPMAIQSFGSEYANARLNGATDGEAKISAALNAGTEILSEYLFSGGRTLGRMTGVQRGLIPSLLKAEAKEDTLRLIKSSAGRDLLTVFKMLGKDAGEEGMEEVVAGIVQPVLSEAIYGDPANLGTREWWETTGKEAIYAGLLGATLGAGGGVSDVAITAREGMQVRDQAKAEDLISRGLSMPEETTAYKLAVEMQNAKTMGAELGSAELGNLQKAVQEEAQHLRKDKAASDKRVNDALSAENVRMRDIASASQEARYGETVALGQALSETEAKSEQEAQERDQMIRTLQDQASATKYGQVYETAQEAALTGLAANVQVDGEETTAVKEEDERTARGIAAAVARISVGEGRVEDFSRFGMANTVARNAFMEATGVELPTSNAETIRLLQDYNEVQLRNTSEEAHREEIEAFKAQKTEEIVRDVTGGDASEATAGNIELIMRDVPEDDLVLAMQNYKSQYRLGYAANKANSFEAFHSPNFVLDDAQQEAAFRRGLADKKAVTENANKEIRKAKEKEAKQKAKEEKAKAEGKTKKGSHVKDDKLSAKTKESENYKAYLSFFRGFSEKFGMTIELEDLDSLEEYFKGRDDAPDDPAEVNGFYVGGTLHINLEPSEDSTPIIATTFHEFTHRLEKYAPEAYQKYQDFVIQTQYRDDAAAFERAVQRRIFEYGNRGVELTHQGAVNEILADFGAQIATDEKTIRQMFSYDRSMAETIRDYLIEAINTALELIKGQRSIPVLRMSERDLKQARKLWLAAAEESRKNADLEIESDGGVQLSIVEHIVDKSGRDFGRGVLLDTDIFAGVKPRNWGPILRKYVYEKYPGQRIDVTDENGVKETLEIARLNDRINGGRRVIDELARKQGLREQLAVAHVLELAEVSKYDDQTEIHRHQWLDENGWEIRKCYAQNAQNGDVYEVTLNIGNARDGRNILYAISNVKKIDDVDVQYGEATRSTGTSISGDTVSQPADSGKGNDKFNGQFSISAKQDQDYLAAVKRGDMETAQRMVDEAAERAGYTSNSDYQGTSAFNGEAPGPMYYESKEERKEAWDNDEYDDNQTLGDYADNGVDLMNLDFFLNDSRAIRNRFMQESISNLRTAVRNGKKTITMYRSVPANIAEDSFRNGDWITPSRSYAIENAEVHGWGGAGQYRIIEQEVSIDDIWWDGNDINEWGYNDGTEYVYKNTANNRKLPAITYDDDGNVIPLSQRFDESNPDIRFSISTDSKGRTLTDGQREFFKDSKVRDENGNLKVMYHGTPNAGFTVFDITMARASGTLGRGFYFSDSASQSNLYGDPYEVYLNIEEPLSGDSHEITKDQLRAFVNELAEDEDYGIDNYGYGATVDSVTEDVWGKSDLAMIRDLSMSAVGNMVEAVQLFNEVNGTNYDGIITDTETVVWEPDQIKLTSNENPTEDPDIRFSITADSGRTITEMVTASYAGQMNLRVESREGKDLAGYLEYVEYEGTPYVQYIHTEDDYRRKGVATELLQFLQSEYPDVEIDFGFTTPDGTKLLESVTYETVDREIQSAFRRLDKVRDAQAKTEKRLEELYEKLDNNQLSEEETEELRRKGDLWETQRDIIYNHEEMLEGKKATRRMVRMPDDNQSRQFRTPGTGEAVQWSLRTEAPPQKTEKGYKVFFVKDGKLYPPMVANPGGEDTPVGVWLDADEGTRTADSKTGRPQVKAGGKGTQGTSGSLAYRPGWHLGSIPLAHQFDRLNPETGKKELFPAQFVWAECEIAADVDYQEEAMSYGYTDNGKFRHSYAGLPRLPKDGFYRYRTNPNPNTEEWMITGAMKVTRLLSDEEVNQILIENGREPVQRQGGNKTLEDLGLAQISADQDDIRFSLQTRLNETQKNEVSYEGLVAKGNLTIATTEETLPRTRNGRYNPSDVSKTVIKNARAANNPLNTPFMTFLHNDDTGIDINIGRQGVRHGIYDTSSESHLETAQALMAFNGLVKNAIRINYLKPREGFLSSQLFLGIARTPDGVFVARFIVNETDEHEYKANDFETMFRLGSSNATKISADSQRIVRQEALPGIESADTVSVAKLLEIVNDAYPDALSEDVLEHFGKTKADIRGSFGNNKSLVDSTQFSLATESRLHRQDLEKQVERLKRDKRLTKGLEPKANQVAQFVRKMQEDYSSDYSLNESVRAITGIYKMIREGDDFAEVYGAVQDLARSIADSSFVMREVEGNEEAVEMRGYFKSHQGGRLTLHVPKELYGEFDRVGGISQFRRDYADVVRLSPTQGVDIDEAMTEIVDFFGEQWDYYYSNKGNYIDAMIDAIRLAGSEDAKKGTTEKVYKSDNRDPWQEAMQDPSEWDDLGVLSEIREDEVNMIIDDIFEAVEGSIDPDLTFADRKKMEKERALAKQRKRLMDSKKEALRILRETKNEEIREAKKEGRAKAAEVRANERERARRLLDLRREREQQKRAAMQTRASKRSEIRRVEAIANRLAKKLLTPSDANHVPERYRKAIAEMLASLDFESTRTDQWEERYGRPSKRVANFRKLREEYDRILKDPQLQEFVEPDDQIYEWIRYLEEMDGMRLADMEAEQVRAVRQVVQVLEHHVNYANRMLTEGLKETRSEMALEAHLDIASAKTGKGKDLSIQKFIKGEATPVHFFDRLGLKTFKDLYEKLTEAQDQHIRNLAEAMQVTQGIADTYGKKNIKAWSENTRTFTVSNGTEIELTDAQLMSLYALNKRDQARGHLLGAGVVVAPLKVKRTLKGRVKEGEKERLEQTFTRLTYKDVTDLLSNLSEEQIKAAETMLSFLKTTSRWGNETSMKLYGYQKFNEENYFPIQSAREYLNNSSLEESQDGKMKNAGFTKSTQTGASNPVVLDDFFDVTTSHINQMSQYNTFVPILEDMDRVYHHVEKDNKGLALWSVKGDLRDKYGAATASYIEKLMRDVNGNMKTEVSDLQAMDQLVRNWKAAKIGLSFRVLFQQPTAVVRAMQYIDPKYFAGTPGGKAALSAVIPETVFGRDFMPKEVKAARDRMYEIVPLAMWKHWGYSQTDIHRSMRDTMMGNEGILDKVFFDMYGKADDFGWSSIFMAVERETRKEHPELEYDSPEYREHVNKRFREIADRTQVVDSVLHRSEIMREQNILSKTMTAFMAEPTISINTIMTGFNHARVDWQNGNKATASKMAARTASVFFMNAVAVSLASSLSSAIRESWTGDDDDDDEKNFIEERLLALGIEEGSLLYDWLGTYFENDFTGNINPLNMLPITKDIISMMEGYDMPNPTLALPESILKNAQSLWKWIGDPEGQRYTGGYYIERNIEAIAELFGIPASNIRKEVDAFTNMYFRALGEKDYGDYLEDRWALNDDYSGNKSTFIDHYINAKTTGHDKSAEEIYKKLKEQGITDDEINDRVWNKVDPDLKQHVLDGVDTSAAEEKLKTMGITEDEIEDKKISWFKTELGKAVQEQDGSRVTELSNILKDTYGEGDYDVEKKIKSAAMSEAWDYIDEGDYDSADDYIYYVTRYTDFDEDDVAEAVSSHYMSDYYEAMDAGNMRRVRELRSTMNRYGVTDDVIYEKEAGHYKDYYRQKAYMAMKSGNRDEAYRIANAYTTKYPGAYKTGAQGMIYGLDNLADSTKEKYENSSKYDKWQIPT